MSDNGAEGLSTYVLRTVPYMRNVTPRFLRATMAVGGSGG